MAKAVVFAMIASFILSRTLVPTMGNWLLRAHAGPHTHEHMAAHDATAGQPGTNNPSASSSTVSRSVSRRSAAGMGVLSLALANQRKFVIGFMSVVLVSFVLVPFLGRNFFPSVDSGQINIHVRAPTGTRLEETAAQFDHIETRIKQVVPRRRSNRSSTTSA
jgi:multidrug efflux pump subunit AcrB